MSKPKSFYGPHHGPQPGQYPFTSGVYKDMYRQRHWTMRQYAGFGTAGESNQRFHYLLNQGVTGLSVAFDLPTQIGYDSDHPIASGEVGRVGVAISSLADMEILLKDIPLDKVSTSMTINATAPILLAMYIAVARKAGIGTDQLQGTVQNDVLKEYIARGTYIYPPAASMRLITDLFAYCIQEVPNWNTISISGYHIREAGSTAVEELAFTFANGIAYVQAALDAGLNVNTFGKRLSFFFNVQMDFFGEIAKFRAARRIWAKIMKKRFGATEPKAMMCRFHTQTAGSSLTAQQIDNNVVRTTLEATAAVLGGTQSLHTNSRDEALSLPTEASVRLALRTQQIIAWETGIPQVADPLAGSYYIEELTDNLEAEVMTLIKRIDDLGGAVPAIEARFQEQQIAQSAYDFQRNIDSGEQVIVGVNRFEIDEEQQNISPAVNDAAVAEQIAGIAKVKADRDQGAVDAARAALKVAADGTDNLMPHILACVEAYATLGEIADTLRNVFEEFKPR